MKVCPRCEQPKERFNSNRICSDCDRERHREIEAVQKQFREQAESYLERHQKRREQEETLLRETQGPQSLGGGVLGFGEPEFSESGSGLSTLLFDSHFLRAKSKDFSWKAV